MHESRKVGLGTTVEYTERKFKTKAWSALWRKTPGEVRARTWGTKSPSRSEAMRFIDSSKSPSTKIDGSLVNFRRRLSNRHGRPRRMLIMDIRRKHRSDCEHVNVIRSLSNRHGRPRRMLIMEFRRKHQSCWNLVRRFYIPKRNKFCYRFFNFDLEVEIWMKNLQKSCFTISIGFDENNFLRRSKIKNL